MIKEGKLIHSIGGECQAESLFKKLIMGDFSIYSALFFTYWEKLFIEECLLINKHGRNNRIRKILFCKTPSSNSNHPHHRWVDWGRGYGKAPLPQIAWWLHRKTFHLKWRDLVASTLLGHQTQCYQQWHNCHHVSRTRCSMKYMTSLMSTLVKKCGTSL